MSPPDVFAPTWSETCCVSEKANAPLVIAECSRVIEKITMRTSTLSRQLVMFTFESLSPRACLEARQAFLLNPSGAI